MTQETMTKIGAAQEKLLKEESQIVNGESIIRLEIYGFTTCKVVIDSGKNHQWMLKSLIERFFERPGYSHDLKKPYSTDYLLVTKSKR